MIHPVCVNFHDLITVDSKFHDLITVSAKFQDLFKWGQEQTQEGNQFKTKKSVAASEHPTHCWENSLRYCRKLEKLFLPVENFLADMDQKGLAKDSRQNMMHAAHYIKSNIIEEFLTVLITETGVLE